MELLLPSLPVDDPHRVEGEVLHGIVCARQDHPRLELGVVDCDVAEEDVPMQQSCTGKKVT